MRKYVDPGHGLLCCHPELLICRLIFTERTAAWKIQCMDQVRDKHRCDQLIVSDDWFVTLDVVVSCSGKCICFRDGWSNKNPPPLLHSKRIHQPADGIWANIVGQLFTIPPGQSSFSGLFPEINFFLHGLAHWDWSAQRFICVHKRSCFRQSFDSGSGGIECRIGISSNFGWSGCWLLGPSCSLEKRKVKRINGEIRILLFYYFRQKNSKLADGPQNENKLWGVDDFLAGIERWTKRKTVWLSPKLMQK